MKEIIEFIVENWGKITSTLIPIAWIIVRLTPTKSDDAILKIIVKIIKIIPDRKKRRKNKYS